MLLAFEVFTVLILIIATLTGVMAIMALSEKQKTFSVADTYKKGVTFYNNKDLVKFGVYFVLMVSTFGSLLTAFLRVMWYAEVGWGETENRWTYWWLTSHALDGITFTVVHLLVYMRQMRLGEADNG